MGREGNDTLYSGAGDDTLTGGAGSDQFEFALWGNDSDTITDLTMDDRVCVYSALLSGSASAGDGSTVGRFEVQCAAGAGYTDLYIGTNTTPGPEVVLHLLGSFGANQFVLDGQFIRLSQPVAGTSIGGTAAADALAGTPGNDQIDGGAGLDTLWATFASSGYQVTRGTTGFVVSGPEGVDALTGVERVRFTDNMGIALDIDGHGGQAYRLYQAAFDRAPDLPGLGYQMNDLDRGWSLSWVANNFIASPEFQATYGSVDNTQFITLLYQNVLNRAPDDGGLQFHLNEFAQGESRADMLTHFSESPENQANVIGQIQNGMQFVPLV